MLDKGRLVTRVALVVGSLAASRAQAQVVDYYHVDGLGSVRVVTSASGLESERHDYLPFGEEVSPPPNAQPLRFTGKERDPETGLDYFQARYYGSAIGRFTSVDPMQARATLRDPQQWNRYAYARNNPLRYLDPTGRYVFEPGTSDTDQRRFKDALGRGDTAAKGLEVGDERADVEAAVAAYGNEGDDRVVVSFADMEAGGETRPGPRPGTRRVVLNANMTADQLVVSVAHEGQHVLIARGEAKGSSSKYPEEVSAYVISALVAKGLRWPDLKFVGPLRDYQIWNEKDGIRFDEIQAYIRDSPHYGPKMPESR